MNVVLAWNFLDMRSHMLRPAAPKDHAPRQRRFVEGFIVCAPDGDVAGENAHRARATRSKQLASFVEIEARAARMKFRGVAIAEIAQEVGLYGARRDKSPV